MDKVHRLLSIVVLCMLPFASTVAGTNGSSTGEGHFLGADPGYGMRSWEDLYPGLDLTPEQRHQLADIRVETLREVRAARDDLSVGPQERMRRVGEARRIGREQELAVLTPEQREHLLQNPPCRSPLLDRQKSASRGQSPSHRHTPAPRNNNGLVPGVDDLTDEQTNRIAAIRRETQQQVQAVQRERTLTSQQKAARTQEIQREGHDRIMEVLTADQRAAFENQWRQSRGGSRSQ